MRKAPEVLTAAVFAVLASVALTLTGCAGLFTEQVYPAHPLVSQILKPRKGFDGKLTNRICLNYENATCTRPEITAYDLADPIFRETANKLGFICNVAGRRFKVCKDKAGLCRISYHKEGWFNEKTVRDEEFLPVAKYQFYLDANVKCFNKDEYPFQGVK